MTPASVVRASPRRVADAIIQDCPGDMRRISGDWQCRRAALKTGRPHRACTIASAVSARSTAPAGCFRRKDRRLAPARDSIRAATAKALNFAATLALSLLFASSQAQAIGCPNASDMAVHVIAFHGEIVHSSSIGIEEIRRLAGPDTVARHYPLLGMAGSAVAVRIATDVDFRLDLPPT